jgi:hypothetical protein
MKNIANNPRDPTSAERHHRRMSPSGPAAAAVVIGFMASMTLASFIRIGEFVPHALFFWIPQASVVIILIGLHAQQAVVAGIALIMALYLGAFGVPLLLPTVTPLAAGMYLVGLGCGAVTAALALILFRRRPQDGERAASLMPCAAMLTVLSVVTASTALFCRSMEFGY